MPLKDVNCPVCKGTGRTKSLTTQEIISCGNCISGKITISVDKDGKPTGCFHPETLIHTTEGEVRICDVRRGMFLRSGKLGARSSTNKVLRLKSYEDRSLLEISLEGTDRSIRVTRYHSVFTVKHGARWACMLKPGDEVHYYDKCGHENQRVVRSVKKHHKLGKVYNIIADGDATFIADGCLTRSYSVLAPQRALMSRIFQNPIDHFTYKRRNKSVLP